MSWVNLASEYANEGKPEHFEIVRKEKRLHKMLEKVDPGHW